MVLQIKGAMASELEDSVLDGKRSHISSLCFSRDVVVTQFLWARKLGYKEEYGMSMQYLHRRMAFAAMVSVSLKASWETQPRPNPLLKNRNPKTARPSIPLTATSTTLTTINKNLTASELLNCNNQNPTPGKLESNNLYLGYDTWAPVPPKVKKPRSIYNAASLAYIGDCIYELYARRHFLFPPLSIEEYNDRVMAVVRCEAQDALLKELLNDDYLSEEERGILRWGKNTRSGKTRTTKRAGVAVYNRASSLETLVGYLYLTNMKRLEEIMLKLGFSTGASTELILKETEGNLDCE
ncbi:hypothetical protein HHK36_025502 [Tetracentron sinense]|uniref:RNase III domain-containing protein n=1 Tax=Tetracentron sinense TaxID=13715 RepID=A0A834YMR0_TETSI|nr:hypothetical protein HHK36_025502 [Tetracentron sinense]